MTTPESSTLRTSQSSPTTDFPTRQLTRSEFHTAMVHLYRGEVNRANTWRMRLDGTTNWAVLTTAASLSFAFSSASNTHVMLLINSMLIFFFMFIEARRYRFYDLWRSRIRLLEIELFAEMLTPTARSEHESWRALLADDLLHPRFSITIWDALGRRLRRNYVWIFGVLLLSWVVKVAIHPVPVNSLQMLRERIAIGPLPDYLVLFVGVCFNLFLCVLALSTLDQSKRDDDEVLPREETRQRMGTGEDPRT
jgi:uncharacterized membrane protein